MGAIAGGLIAAAGGLFGADAAGDAADAQVQAARIAANTQMRMFNKANQLQKPWRDAGQMGLNRLKILLRLGEDKGQPNFGKYFRSDLPLSKFQEDPGYQFRMDEGMKALERSAAARGMVLSGPMMKGIQRFGQDLASTEYSNAFNRYQVERNAALNPYQSLAGLGQTISAQQSQNAMNTGRGIAETQLQAGNARASGYMGQANALGGALTGLGNAFANSNLFDGGGANDYWRDYTPDDNLGGLY